MAQTNVYVDDECAEDGLTFRKIGRFIKTGWLRMLVYAAIAVALISVVALPIKFFYKTEPVAQTTIEFIYDGIEKGEAPRGGTFDTDNIISTVVLADAVEASGLGGKISDISSLRMRMRVSAVDTDEYVRLVNAAANGDSAAKEQLRTYVMYPMRFDIIISDPESLGLTDSEAVTLLDQTVKCYQKNFKQRYSQAESFSTEAYGLSDNDTYEFTSVYNLYVSSLDTLEPVIDKYNELAPEFVSTAGGASFGMLESELGELRLKYGLFNNYIMINNVWRKDDAAESLRADKELIQVKRTNLDSYITSLKSLIAEIKPNTITSTDSSGKTVTTETYPAKYYDYIDRLDSSNRELLQYDDQLSNIELRLNKLNDGGTAATSAQKQEALAILTELEKDTATFVEKVNTVISDYYDTNFVSSSVRHIRPPVLTRKSSAINLIIVYVCAVIVGLIIGGAVTAIKISATNAKRAKAEEEAKAVAAENTDADGAVGEVASEPLPDEKHGKK